MACLTPVVAAEVCDGLRSNPAVEGHVALIAALGSDYSWRCLLHTVLAIRLVISAQPNSRLHKMISGQERHCR